MSKSSPLKARNPSTKSNCPSQLTANETGVLHATFTLEGMAGLGQRAIPRVELSGEQCVAAWLAISAPADLDSDAIGEGLQPVGELEFATNWLLDETIPDRQYRLTRLDAGVDLRLRMRCDLKFAWTKKPCSRSGVVRRLLRLALPAIG